MDFGRHVVDGPHEGFRIFVQVRCEHKVSDFHVEVFFVVDKQIFRLQISVREPQVVNVLQPVNQLLEVIPGHWLLQAPCFAEHHEEVSLVRWEHKVRVEEASEEYAFRVETLNNIWVVHDRVDLFLILSFINFSLLSFVQFHQHPFAFRFRVIVLGFVANPCE